MSFERRSGKVQGEKKMRMLIAFLCGMYGFVGVIVLAFAALTENQTLLCLAFLVYGLNLAVLMCVLPNRR